LNMAGLEREEFRVLYLNNQNQLIAGETLFTGTINRTEVHPLELINHPPSHPPPPLPPPPPPPPPHPPPPPP
ncbi:JAB domain-containing protein, partial [Escherichia coli]|uniref:JAB domain-containing protein n=1 Tax=Escherichia coli TaxID=562 RepID=UPI003D33C914